MKMAFSSAGSRSALRSSGTRCKRWSAGAPRWSSNRLTAGGSARQYSAALTRSSRCLSKMAARITNHSVTMAMVRSPLMARPLPMNLSANAGSPALTGSRSVFIRVTTPRPSTIIPHPECRPSVAWSRPMASGSMAKSIPPCRWEPSSLSRAMD